MTYEPSTVILTAAPVKITLPLGSSRKLLFIDDRGDDHEEDA